MDHCLALSVDPLRQKHPGFVGTYDFHLAQLGGHWRIDSFGSISSIWMDAELERDG